jgi:uncharacterized protein
MKKGIFIAVILSVVLLVVFFLNFSMHGNKKNIVKIKEASFKTELVSSDQKRQLGLSGRTELCLDCSMLFVFPREDFWGFWMKDMNFNLDIIWVNGNKIVDIAENVDKNLKITLYPEYKADKVLELNSGTVKSKGFKTGDIVEIKH